MDGWMEHNNMDALSTVQGELLIQEPGEPGGSHHAATA